MASGRYDTIIEQGATFTRQITWQNKDGTPIDITGYSFSGKIRKTASDNKVIASFTFTTVNAANGIFKFSLTPAETSLLPSAFSSSAEKSLLKCSYDIEASIGSNVYRILEGVISISQEVTR